MSVDHVIDDNGVYEWINGWMVRPGVIEYYECERCKSLESDERVELQAPHVRIGRHWQNCLPQ